MTASSNRTSSVDQQVVLYEVLRAAGEYLEPQRVLDSAVSAVAEHTPWPIIQILLPDSSGERLIVQASRGSTVLEEGMSLTAEQGVIGRAFRQGQTQYVADVGQDPDYIEVRAQAAAGGQGSELAVPLLRREQVLGVLNIEDDQPDAFQLTDIRLAESLAEVIALSLDNASLFAATERHAQEQEQLHEAVMLISSTLDLATVLERLAEQLCRASHCTSTYICRYEVEHNRSTVLAEHLSAEAVPEEQVSDLGESYVEEDEAFLQLLLEGRCESTTLSDPALPAWEREHMLEYGAKSILYLPLQLQGETIGFVELWDSRRERPFTPTEITNCQNIAQQAAFAIQNAYLYNEMAQAMAQVKRSNETLEQFAYVVSHDLKAPLRAITNLAHWLEEDLEPVLTPDTRRQLDLLRDRVSQMRKMIDDILHYSRTIRLREEIEEVAVGELIRKVLYMLAPPERFTINVEPQMPHLHAEPIKLSQIFSNLISNALKYHDRPDGQITITCDQGEAYYTFHVSDNGPGIPPAQHDQIFEMFQTLQAGDNKESTGIGLALVKKLVEDEGGSIRVRSQEGEGTTFSFDWPKEAS